MPTPGNLPLSRARRMAALALALVVVCCALVTPGAARADGSGYYVTFVARSCPAYTDIFPNRARNDIQESLKDLAPGDSPYSGDFLVDPMTEDSAPQNVCSALPDWAFTLGESYESRVVTGPWGSLSKVTSPFHTRIVTHHSTPLYDQHHAPVGDEQLTGATTIELTEAERQQANSPDQLWVQGGVPHDPVLNDTFPGPMYGFGALRCATDDLNGDNVEYIYFPAGVTHVFCYALYVLPPPTSGTITIKKQVVGAPAGDNPSFPFNGSLSFDPDGFTLADGQSKDFYRAGGSTWDVTEGAVDGFKLTDVHCTATATGGGPGDSTFTVSGATTSIDLAAGEDVTCVYTNTYQPPSGGLTISKVTRGGVGAFGYEVTPDSGGDVDHVVATTTMPDVPVIADPSLQGLAPGGYTITERSPSTDRGHWDTVSVSCDGVPRRPGHPVHVRIVSRHASSCSFVNEFVPSGSITVSKISHGALGTFGFVIDRQRDPVQYLEHATTTTEGEAATAVAASPVDATDHLTLGTYVVTEQFPPSDPTGAWSLNTVACNGELEPFDRGSIEVTLTRDVPDLDCVYVDGFSATPDPPTSPAPEPPLPPLPPGPPTPGTPAPPTPNPAYPLTDLSITKQALAPVVRAGNVVSFRITVANHGPDAAERVVVTDGSKVRARILSARPSQGSCQIRRVVACELGNLKVGAHATVLVRGIPEPRFGRLRRFSNVAVVGSETDENNLVNNRAVATVRIVHPPSSPVLCPSVRGPEAHAAC